MNNIVFEHRVYFDPVTKECTRKDVVLQSDVSTESYVVVTREEYEDIEFCLKFYVTKDNEIKRKRVDFGESKKLQLSTVPTTYQTIADNNIFRVDDAYLGDSDYWTLRGYD